MVCRHLYIRAFHLEPISIIIEPIMIFIASAYGINCECACESSCIAINGDHEPIIKPPLYAKPDALFLIIVGNLSDRNAGIGPNAVEAN